MQCCYFHIPVKLPFTISTSTNIHTTSISYGTVCTCFIDRWSHWSAACMSLVVGNTILAIMITSSLKHWVCKMSMEHYA